MEANTDRMWWTIGALVLGGVLITGAVLIFNTNILPGVKTQLENLFSGIKLPAK